MPGSSNQVANQALNTSSSPSFVYLHVIDGGPDEITLDPASGIFSSTAIVSNGDVSGTSLTSNTSIGAGTYVVCAYLFGMMDIRTASGQTVTLTNTSNMQQYFSGSGNATVVLPVTSTLYGTGVTFIITNAGTGTITVQSSGANTIQAMAPGTTLTVKMIASGGTGTNQWSWEYGNSSLSKVNGTESANAVTASGSAGVITTSSLSTAAGGNYAITWTNTFITSTSGISLQIVGGTNTINNIMMKCAPGSGSATLTIYNNDASSALDGTLLISYLVY